LPQNQRDWDGLRGIKIPYKSMDPLVREQGSAGHRSRERGRRCIWKERERIDIIKIRVKSYLYKGKMTYDFYGYNTCIYSYRWW
jgi:hypothetical protein